MAPQCSSSWEAFIADTAAVWFDPCVASHMRFHVLEAFTADVAGPTGLFVRLQVSQQTIR